MTLYFLVALGARPWILELYFNWTNCSELKGFFGYFFFVSANLAMKINILLDFNVNLILSQYPMSQKKNAKRFFEDKNYEMH
jgi:hypothetical protein